MESEGIVKCQGKPCDALAVTHAVFGMRVFESDIHISDTPDTFAHLDLCAKHIAKVHDQYRHVTEHTLGECPEHKKKARRADGHSGDPETGSYSNTR